jgi:peptidoglycan/LPS O-acetylase OafA/YrhL
VAGVFLWHIPCNVSDIRRKGDQIWHSQTPENQGRGYENMAQVDLKPLTSLRFFAALWVIIFTYWPLLAGHIDIGLFNKGYLGVELFFVLSGFILGHVYLDEIGEGRFVYGRFLVHRIARIYPLHIATLLLTLGMVFAASARGMNLDPNIASWESLPAQLLMVHAWGLAPEAAWNHPSWSISAEWFAYLLFPVIAAIAWHMKNKPMIAVGFSALFLVLAYTVFPLFSGFDLTHATFQWGALRILPCFVFGAMLNLAYRSGAVSNPNMATLGAAISSLMIIVSSSFAGTGNDMFIVLALGLMILSLAGFAREDASLISSPVLVYLGEISFAMYMLYVPWKWVFVKAAGLLLGSEETGLPFMWWLAGLVALVPLSMLAHHLVELPMRRVVRGWGDQIRFRLAYAMGR